MYKAWSIPLSILVVECIWLINLWKSKSPVSLLISFLLPHFSPAWCNTTTGSEAYILYISFIHSSKHLSVSLKSIHPFYVGSWGSENKSVSGKPNIFNKWWTHLKSQEAETTRSARSQLSEPAGCDKEDRINHILIPLWSPAALGTLSCCYTCTCPTRSASYSPGYTSPTLQLMQVILYPQSSKALTNSAHTNIQ